MYKKTITYTDYNGNTRTEDFYFNMNKAELTEYAYSRDGGLDQVIARVANEQNIKETIQIFKDLILRAYGKKSDDGKRFIKTPELAEEFSQTEAYSNLFMELGTNAQAAADFINGIVPADLRGNLAEAKDKLPEDVKSVVERYEIPATK